MHPYSVRQRNKTLLPDFLQIGHRTKIIKYLFFFVENGKRPYISDKQVESLDRLIFSVVKNLISCFRLLIFLFRHSADFVFYPGKKCEILLFPHS